RKIGRSGDRIENIADEREVIHLLNDNATDQRRNLVVCSLFNRIERREVRRNRAEFQFDRVCERDAKVVDRVEFLPLNVQHGYSSPSMTRPLLMAIMRFIGVLGAGASSTMISIAAAATGGVPRSGLPSLPGSLSQRRIAVRLPGERSRVTGIEFGSPTGSENTSDRMPVFFAIDS